MIDNREATLRDEALIKTITEGLNLNSAKDIKKIYSELQTGLYSFESSVGRDFDDHIYELMEKVKSGEIKDEVQDVKGKKSKPSRKKPKETSVKQSQKKDSKKDTKKYSDKDLDILVQLELKKRERKRKLITILASFVALLSIGYFVFYYYQNYRTNSDYEQLSELKGSDILSNAVEQNNFTINKKAIKTPDILKDYATLYAKNKKLAGWLKIDGTKIDYPVMQTTDNEYYLNHNYNQEKDNNGSLFLDCSCSLYPRSTNMIIYGHHMKSGSMFGNLQKYANEKYGKEHSIITFDTIYEHATYQVMYVFYSKVYDTDELVFKYYQFIDANSEKEFDYYMSEMEAVSLYDTGVTASFGDSLLTLSTCDSSQSGGRFAVVAKRIN